MNGLVFDFCFLVMILTLTVLNFTPEPCRGRGPRGDPATGEEADRSDIDIDIAINIVIDINIFISSCWRRCR